MTRMVWHWLAAFHDNGFSCEGIDSLETFFRLAIYVIFPLNTTPGVKPHSSHGDDNTSLM